LLGADAATGDAIAFGFVETDSLEKMLRADKEADDGGQLPVLQDGVAHGDQPRLDEIPVAGLAELRGGVLSHQVPEMVELPDLLEIKPAGEEIAGIEDFADDEIGVDEGAAEKAVRGFLERFHGGAEGVLVGLLVCDGLEVGEGFREVFGGGQADGVVGGLDLRRSGEEAGAEGGEGEDHGFHGCCSWGLIIVKSER